MLGCAISVADISYQVTQVGRITLKYGTEVKTFTDNLKKSVQEFSYPEGADKKAKANLMEALIKSTQNGISDLVVMIQNAPEPEKTSSKGSLNIPGSRAVTFVSGTKAKIMVRETAVEFVATPTFQNIVAGTQEWGAFTEWFNSAKGNGDSLTEASATQLTASLRTLLTTTVRPTRAKTEAPAN